MVELEEINGKHSNKGKACVCLNGDLANMYTSLDHKSIIQAVEAILADVQAKTRRKEVAIPKSKILGSPHLGGSASVDEKV